MPHDQWCAGQSDGDAHRSEDFVNGIGHYERRGTGGESGLKNGLPDTKLGQQADHIKPTLNYFLMKILNYLYCSYASACSHSQFYE